MEITASLFSARLEPLTSATVAAVPNAAASQQFAALMQAPAAEIVGKAAEAAAAGAAASAAGTAASAAASSFDSVGSVGHFDSLNRDGRGSDSRRDGHSSTEDGDNSRDEGDNVGDKILNGMQHLSDEFQANFIRMSDMLRPDGPGLGIQQLLSLQLNLTKTTMETELMGKLISRSAQHIDQLVRVQ